MSATTTIGSSAASLVHAIKDTLDFTQDLSLTQDEKDLLSKHLHEYDCTAKTLLSRSAYGIENLVDGPLAELDRLLHRIRDEVKYWRDIGRDEVVRFFHRNTEKVGRLIHVLLEVLLYSYLLLIGLFWRKDQGFTRRMRAIQSGNR